jgi:hypothetical protein
MIRVYAKKRFEFKSPNGERVQTTPLGFCNLPDWVEKTDLFKLARKAKEIEVLASPKEEKNKEKELADGEKGKGAKGKVGKGKGTGDDGGDGESKETGDKGDPGGNGSGVDNGSGEGGADVPGQ